MALSQSTLDAIAAAVASAFAAQAAAQAPVRPEAAAPLYVSDKPHCALHAADACTRKLSHPDESHVPCSGADDPMHARLRKSHRHF